MDAIGGPNQADQATPDSMLGEMDRRQLETAYMAVRAELTTDQMVIAVLAERLLAATKGAAVTITDEALAQCPDLTAWRDSSLKQVVITVGR